MLKHSPHSPHEYWLRQIKTKTILLRWIAPKFITLQLTRVLTRALLTKRRLIWLKKQHFQCIYGRFFTRGCTEAGKLAYWPVQSSERLLAGAMGFAGLALLYAPKHILYALKFFYSRINFYAYLFIFILSY